MNQIKNAVDMRGITKRFGAAYALRGVTFQAGVGEVHALLGENGAGKSSLVSVLTGLYRPDDGTVEVYGKRLELGDPQTAIKAGVGFVPQDFRLDAALTVTENVILGEKGKGLFLSRTAAKEAVEADGRRYGLGVNPQAIVDRLSVGEKQRVAILRALYRGARVLILDEPTSVLTPQAAQALFDTMRVMADEGKTVIFISHKLDEVMSVADRITVLRQGRAVDTLEKSSTTSQELIRLMVGREVQAVHSVDRGPGRAAVVLKVNGLEVAGDRGDTVVRDVSFDLREGDILGVAGVEGNGQHELAEALAGLRRFSAGVVVIGGSRLKSSDPRAAIQAGIAYCPEDRKTTGLAPGLSPPLNAVLRSVGQHSAGWLLNWGSIRRQAAKLIDKFNIKIADRTAPTGNLSGGNQQKLMLGREIDGQPKLLIVVSPTQGLDVGAIQAMHQLIIDSAADGTAVLLVSKELDEIFGLANRIMVIYDGRLTEVERATATAEELGHLMTGSRQ